MPRSVDDDLTLGDLAASTLTRTPSPVACAFAMHPSRATPPVIRSTGGLPNTNVRRVESETALRGRGRLSGQEPVGRLDYLLASEGQMRPLWTALQILPSLDSGQDSVHSAPLRIYDRSGVRVATLHAGADLTEENLLHDIRTALATDSR